MIPQAHGDRDINASQIFTTLQPLKDLYLVAMVTDCACQAYRLYKTWRCAFTFRSFHFACWPEIRGVLNGNSALWSQYFVFFWWEV